MPTASRPAAVFHPGHAWLCPAMTHADISHPLRSCSMSRHSPYMSGLSNVHLRAGSQCPLAIPSMHGSLQRNRVGCSYSLDRWPPNTSSCKHEMCLAAYRTKNAPCLFAQRISDSTYHFAAAPACAMTSSAKLSCLFSMPSPVSKRTKSLMTIFVPFALPT